MSLMESFVFVKQRRTIARPRIYLLQALTEYETKVRGDKVVHTSWSNYTEGWVTRRMPDFIMRYYKEFYLYQEFLANQKN